MGLNGENSRLKDTARPAQAATDAGERPEAANDSSSGGAAPRTDIGELTKAIASAMKAYAGMPAAPAFLASMEEQLRIAKAERDAAQHPNTSARAAADRLVKAQKARTAAAAAVAKATQELNEAN